MIKPIKYIFGDKALIKDNLTLFVSTLILNIFAYIFHILVGRVLGPNDYGIFGSLFALIYIVVIPLFTIQTGIAKFVSEFKVKKEPGKIAYLFSRSLKKMFIYGLIFTTIFLVLSPLIGRFLKIDNIAIIIILAPFFFFALLLHVEKGVLQGLQDFKMLGFNMMSEGLLKLLFGALFLFLGFRVGGAMFAFVLSYAIPFFIFLYLMKELLKTKQESFDTKKVYSFSIPVLLILISLTAFYTLDVLLVKHLFDSVSAGHYAALALLGKVILFGSVSIPMVMFPKVSESHARKENHKHLLYRSSLFVLAFGSAVTLFYFLFPEFAIRLLFGEQYLDIANLLGLYGIIMTIFSLIYVISFYKMSIDNTNFLYLLVLFNIMEIILIYVFHDSLLKVIQILLALMAVLFLFLAPTYKNEIVYNNSGIQ